MLAAEFVRGKIRAAVSDPATARLLSPEHTLGCKRLCVDTGYCETFNQPHVQLVDVSHPPIAKRRLQLVVGLGVVCAWFARVLCVF